MGVKVVQRRMLDDYGVPVLFESQNNPRVISSVDVEQLAVSIEADGFREPLIVLGSGEIVAGRKRYRAAVKLGLKEVPCILPMCCYTWHVGSRDHDSFSCRTHGFTHVCTREWPHTGPHRCGNLWDAIKCESRRPVCKHTRRLVLDSGQRRRCADCWSAVSDAGVQKTCLECGSPLWGAGPCWCKGRG